MPTLIEVNGKFINLDNLLYAEDSANGIRLNFATVVGEQNVSGIPIPPELVSLEFSGDDEKAVRHFLKSESKNVVVVYKTHLALQKFIANPLDSSA